MDIYVSRRIFTHKSTVGKLIFNDFSCWTLEDTSRKRDLNYDGILQPNEKVYGTTAIPSGVYEVYIRESARYKRKMPYLKDVPLFDAIMIHWGNVPENTNGCLLVGTEHKTEDAITESKKAFDALFPLIEKALSAGSLRIHIAGGYRGRDE